MREESANGDLLHAQFVVVFAFAWRFLARCTLPPQFSRRSPPVSAPWSSHVVPSSFPCNSLRALFRFCSHHDASFPGIVAFGPHLGLVAKGSCI